MATKPRHKWEELRELLVAERLVMDHALHQLQSSCLGGLVSAVK